MVEWIQYSPPKGVVQVRFLSSAPMDIKRNYPIAGLSTFKIGGKASYFAEIKSERDLEKATEFAEEKKMPIFILGAMWGILYLVQIRHLSRNEAAEVTAMIFWGTIVGSLALGWLSDFLRRRKMIMVIGAILSLALILILMYAPELSYFNLMVLFFVLGITTSAQIISYPLIAESNPLSLTGSAEGLASTLIMAGGTVQIVASYLIKLHWDHQTVDQVSIYSLGDYRLMMWIMPIGFIGGLIASLLIKETYCRPYEETHSKGL